MTETTLTMQSIRDAARLMGDGPRFGHFADIVVMDHPMELYGHEITALRAPPWFGRILRFFGISDFVCWLSQPMLREPPALVFDGKIIMTPRQYAALKGIDR